MLHLHLFGTPLLIDDDHPIALTRRKAIALLAYLAVTDRAHSREALATLLWPDTPPEKSRAALRTVLWSLGKLPLEIVADAETVALDTRQMRIDVRQFRMFVSQADDIAALTEAMALYQADFLDGFHVEVSTQFEEWVRFESADLRQTLRNTLTKLIEHLTAQNDYTAAAEHARRLVALDPLDEAAQRQLIRIYALAGQQRAALAQFAACEAVLDETLGVAVSAETHELIEQIKRGTFSLPTFIPNNLPPSVSRFVGRSAEIAAITRLLTASTTRLLTILGSGGIGKTRLGLAVLEQQVDKQTFRDGVFFVPLVSLTEPSQIVLAILSALSVDVSEKDDPRRQLFTFLRDKSLLLLLDNFEHLLDGADVVADLLQHALNVTLLITSREPLDLYDEQRYPLSGLSVGEGEAFLTSPAATLFVERVRRQQPNFTVRAAEAQTLAAISRLLEGMPLAIELAASRSIVLSLDEIRAELEQSLDILQTDTRNVPARHRNMRAVIDGSWRSLSETERAVFVRLALFRGGFTREAAQAIAAASIDTLTKLVNCSLLRFSPRTRRFDLHELLRQYAAERLSDDERDELREEFGRYFAQQLAQAAADLKSARFMTGMAWIEAEYDNVRLAWQIASEGCMMAELAQGLEAVCLYHQWRHRPQEGMQLCDIALAGGVESADLRIRLMAWRTELARRVSRESILQANLEMIESLLTASNVQPETRAHYLLARSNVMMLGNQTAQSIALNEESIALYRAAGDRWGEAQALDPLSLKQRIIGNRAQALARQQACMALRRVIGNPREIAHSHTLLALFQLHLGQFAASTQHLNSALAIFRELGYRAALIHPLSVLSINLIFQGQFERCIAVGEEVLALNEQLGTRAHTSEAEMGIMRASINLGRYEFAQAFGEALLPRYRELGNWWGEAFALFNFGRIALIQNDLPVAEQHLTASAEILGKGEISLYPGVLMHLSIVALKQGDEREFFTYLKESLELSLAAGPLTPMRFELIAMPLWLLIQGDVEQAIELYAAAQQSTYIANSRYFVDLIAKEIEAAAVALSAETVLAARQCGQRRDLWETARLLLKQLGQYVPDH